MKYGISTEVATTFKIKLQKEVATSPRLNHLENITIVSKDFKSHHAGGHYGL